MKLTLVLSFSIHPFVSYHGFSCTVAHGCCWRLAQLSWVEGGVTPCTSCQVITGLPHIVTSTLIFTPEGQFRGASRADVRVFGRVCGRKPESPERTHARCCSCKLKDVLSSWQPCVVSIQTRKSCLCCTC